MAWVREAKRAIIHVDGDAFFASCEQALHPEYQGKPVVTGAERGIVAAASYEAKALGIQRGVKLSDVRKLCPDVIVVPSDYESYSLFSQRMFDIMRRFTSEVEEYGIDEGFADLTGLRRPLRKSYPAIAHEIKTTIEKELNISVSVGLAPSKVLAKTGSNHNKPSGFVVIAKDDIQRFLEHKPAGEIWGIGPQTSHHLQKLGVRTAWQFAQQSQEWIEHHFTKPHQETWHELNGRAKMKLNTEPHRVYKSISKTKTFTPPSTNVDYIFGQLSKNIENAFIKLRRHKLSAQWMRIFLKTQDFRMHGVEVRLTRSTAFPHEVMSIVRELFYRVYQPDVLYRATGVIFADIQSREHIQLNLFEPPVQIEESRRLFEAVDSLATKYGKHTVYLGGSIPAHVSLDTRQKQRRQATERKHTVRSKLHHRQFANIPLLGEVK